MIKNNKYTNTKYHCLEFCCSCSSSSKIFVAFSLIALKYLSMTSIVDEKFPIAILIIQYYWKCPGLEKPS
jgi:hypothetical protein